MPQLTVEGVGAFEVPQGKRMVLALEDDAKVDQLHACGGNARCTTCRVEFVAGEPATMTAAEKSVLAARGLTGIRLSRRASLCASRHERPSHQPPCGQRLTRRRQAARWTKSSPNPCSGVKNKTAIPNYGVK